MSFLKLVLAILVTYRVARLVTIDWGPLNVFGSFRLWLGRSSSTSKVYFALAELFSCPHCFGVWVAAVLALYLQPGSLSDFVIFTFAIAGGQSFLEYTAAGYIGEGIQLGSSMERD